MKKTRKKDDALCNWREYFLKKKEGEGQADVCIEESCRQAPNQEEKVSLIKDIQTYAIYLFPSIWKCFSAFVLMCNVFY